MTEKARQRVRWISICSIFVFVLYATLPLGRPVITFMRRYLDASGQSQLMYGIFSVVAAGGLVYIIARIKTFTPVALVCIILLLRLYYFEFTTLVKYPEERLHFLEYGVLALLLYKAFSIDFKGIWPYVLALVTGSVIGYGDEVVQHCTKYLPALFTMLSITSVDPNAFRRYFGWEDVRINVLGVAYGLLLLITVLQNRRAQPDRPGTEPET